MDHPQLTRLIEAIERLATAIARQQQPLANHNPQLRQCQHCGQPLAYHNIHQACVR